MTYQLTSTASILRQADGASIPADPLNSEYREFLAWCEAGNTPAPYVPPAPTQAELNAPHLAYLASTDWYVLRFVDTGIAVPDAITAARQAARASVQ
jgi:hypothetical protein